MKNDYLHEGINLENTKVIWHCEECGKEFEDDESYQSDICSYCGSGDTWHSHEINNSIEVNGNKYFVNLNYEGESEILNESGERINEKIDGGLYYKILCKYKSSQQLNSN